MCNYDLSDKNIFIYCRGKDAQSGVILRQCLEKYKGFEPFHYTDGRSNPPGAPIADPLPIERSNAEKKYILVLFSPGFFRKCGKNGDVTTQEILHALRNESAQIIPIQIRGFEKKAEKRYNKGKKKFAKFGDDIKRAFETKIQQVNPFVWRNTSSADEIENQLVEQLNAGINGPGRKPVMRPQTPVTGQSSDNAAGQGQSRQSNRAPQPQRAVQQSSVAGQSAGNAAGQGQSQQSNASQQRQSGVGKGELGTKVKKALSPVVDFGKEWGLKAVLPVVLALIVLITLLVCFCGVRGIYVNVDDPNEFYSFDATSYEYHGTLLGEDYVEKGTWKVDDGQLKLTHKGADGKKVTEAYYFDTLDSKKRISVSAEFGVKKEFKRVSLLAYSTPQKIKITLDGNGGNGDASQKVQIGSKIRKPAEPTRDGYLFMGWYTTPDGWKTGMGEQFFFEERVWEKATYYANWKNTSEFNLTGGGLESPVVFTEGDDILAAYMQAMGWDSLPAGVTGLSFKDESCNEIDPSIAPAANIHVSVVYDAHIEDGVLQYVNPVLEEFVIPEGVTSIGSSAFKDCTSLTTITIPDSMTSIGSTDFLGCTSLESLTVAEDNPVYHSAGNCIIETATKTLIVGCNGSVVPNDGSVMSIGDYAFSGCAAITSITIPASVMSIGKYAFKDCVTEIEWSDTSAIIEIGDYAFANYAGISVTIPNSVTSIGEFAFASCKGLTNLIIPDSVRRIANNAFAASGLTRITLPSGLQSISEELFYNCGNLTSITIPNSVTSIGGAAFSGCDSLIAVAIPDSVASIGSSAFYNCDSLESITIPFVGEKKNGTGATHFGYIFGASSDTSNSSYVPESLKAVVINGGKSIPVSAFQNCTSLISVAIGDGVTSIGSAAFLSCSALESVTISDSVTSIETLAFALCTSLISVTIPDSVTSIGEASFGGCDNLRGNEYSNAFYLGNDGNPYLLLIKAKNEYMPYATSVVIHESTRFISTSAFQDCTAITSITIGNSVTHIGQNAFAGCKAEIIWGDAPVLAEIRNFAFARYAGTSITIPDSVTNIGGSAFYNCASLASVTIPNSVTNIGSSAFMDCTSLTSITIPDNVTSIGEWAFWGCNELASVTIGNGVTSIGNLAFGNCYSLEAVYIADIEAWFAIEFGGGDANPLCSGARLYLDGEPVTALTIPNGVKIIRSYVFVGCDSLTSVTIGGSVTSIEESAFEGCYSLSSVTIKDRVWKIGERAFEACYSLASVTIGDSVTSIGDYAFQDCMSLTSVSIGDSVWNIGVSAFDGCTSLTSVTIPDSVTSIGDYAFYGCRLLASVTFEGTKAKWKAVDKGLSWKDNCPFTEVKCSDGVVPV